MKVLITGVNGQIGKALLTSAPKGWACIGLDRPSLDLTDAEAIIRLVGEERPNLVINAAAYTAVDRAELEPELAMAVNFGAPAAFAKALAEYGGRLLQISTDFVFDGTATRPYRPDDARNPLSIYGKSKAMGEDAAGNQSIILRTSWVYAAGGRNFVRTMLRVMREQSELRVVDDQIGSPSWAPDISRTIWELAAKDQPGIYHHCDRGETSWHEFAVAIAEEAAGLGLIPNVPDIKPIPTRDYPTPASRPAYSALDDTTTRGLLLDCAKPWRENLGRMLICELKARH